MNIYTAIAYGYLYGACGANARLVQYTWAVLEGPSVQDTSQNHWAAKYGSY